MSDPSYYLPGVIMPPLMVVILALVLAFSPPKVNPGIHPSVIVTQRDCLPDD